MEKQMVDDLIEIFDKEYEKRRLITPQNTAEKLIAKSYRKQTEGEWLCIYLNKFEHLSKHKCSECGFVNTTRYNYCPNCGAKMKGADDGKAD